MEEAISSGTLAARAAADPTAVAAVTGAADAALKKPKTDDP